MHQNNVQRHNNIKFKKCQMKEVSNPILYFHDKIIPYQFIVPVSVNKPNQSYSLSMFSTQITPCINLELDLKNEKLEQKSICHHLIAYKLFRSGRNIKIEYCEKMDNMMFEIDEDYYEKYWQKGQNNKSFKSFLRKKQSIGDEIIFIQIQQEYGETKNEYLIIFKNIIGMVLFFVRNVKIQQNEKELLKKLQKKFKMGKNLLFIINRTKNHFLNLLYLRKIIQKQNQFIYIHKGYNIINQLNHKSNNNQPIYQFQVDPSKKIYFIGQSTDTIILSQKVLNLYLNNQLQSIIQFERKITNIGYEILQQIYIEGSNLLNITLYLRYLIYNKIIKSRQQTRETNIQNIFLELIDAENELSRQYKQQFIQNMEQNYKQHYPKIMEHCKLCRVCNQNIKQVSIDKKKRCKSNNIVNKIKKTKYCCEGCSIQYGKDISLCVLCFKEFHKNTKYYLNKEELIKYKHTVIQIKQQKQKNINDLPKKFSSILQQILEEIKSLNKKFDEQVSAQKKIQIAMQIKKNENEN